MTKQVNDPEIRFFDPRILPKHLVCGAVFLAAGTPTPEELKTFLSQFDTEFPDPRDLWLVEIWDRDSGGIAVATAVFSVVDHRVECRPMWIDPSYATYELDQYLRSLGSSLWGGLPFMDNDGR